MARRKPSVSLQAAITGHLRYVQAALSPNTYNDYANTHRQFLEFMGDGERPIGSITAADVEGFMIFMREGELPANPLTHQARRGDRRRPKTLANIHTGLSALWAWALERELVDRNVVRQVARPKVHLEPIRPLTPEQVAGLFKACRESRPWHNKPLVANARSTFERDRAMLAVLLETGLRVSELCALRFRDVSFQRSGGMVHVDLGKGNKSRDVPFQRTCANYLSDYLLLRPDIGADDYLFVSSHQERLPMTRGGVQQLVKKLGRKVGVDVSPHDLRTTAACLMVQNGISAWELQRIMGHSDVKTTMRYVRAAQMDLGDVMRRCSPLENLRLR